MLNRVQLTKKLAATSIANFFTFIRNKTSFSAHLVKSITVQTGVSSLYPRLQSRHPHIFPPKVPTEGVTLTVKYADSANNRQTPKNIENFDHTIVALHGIPGYLEHFDVLFREFSGSRVRIIAPNLPDFSHTRSSGGIFWHTTEEKVAFVKDFLLNRLNVRQVDCLVSHSMGAQTALGLAEDPGPLQICSFAFLAPQPQWDVDPKVRTFTKYLFRFRSEAWYRFLTTIQLQNRFQTRFKFSNTNELLWALTTIYDTQTPLNVPRRVYSLAKQSSKVPVIIQYGTKEPVISQRAQLALCTEHFGVPEDRFIYLDLSENKEKELEKITANGDRIKVYYIKDGNHFAHARYGQATKRMIDSLLESIKN